MVLNATFNNISVILWRSVFLGGESGGPGGKHQRAAKHCQTSSTNFVSNTQWDSNSQCLEVIGTDCILLGLWCLTPLSTIIQLYMAVSFIGGRNWSTRRKPPTCCMSLTNFITSSCINWVHLAMSRLELTTLVVICTDCTGSCKSTTIQSRPWWPFFNSE